MTYLRVHDWDRYYETHRTRDVRHYEWLKLRVHHDDEGYIELVAGDPMGAAHFGAWVALLQAAARSKARGTLLRDGGRPHTPESLALLTRIPAHVFEAAIPRLVEIGWLEETQEGPEEPEIRRHRSAVSGTHDGNLAVGARKGRAEGALRARLGRARARKGRAEGAPEKRREEKRRTEKSREEKTSNSAIRSTSIEPPKLPQSEKAVASKLHDVNVVETARAIWNDVIKYRYIEDKELADLIESATISGNDPMALRLAVCRKVIKPRSTQGETTTGVQTTN